ncbi:aldose epimerase [Rufibacter sp. DG15C]|uniref:aldose epimerase family protein n=1 Tax=Rufibacter sp. DG15C TaxID=1379909 RepID=UPI00078B3AC5|nr:aldose epimerase family protein [Rufibacter sp. DG15C]AMM52843.1 aldose epimerase [Rufibacter sp. DG15C]
MENLNTSTQQAPTTHVRSYTLHNKHGMQVTVTNYGGTITSILTPDKNGELGEVVLGFKDVTDYTSEAYLANQPYFGAIIGRYGNRIAKGKFTLNGREYSLATNNGENHLHGGVKGFDKVFWEVEELAAQNALRLTYTSPDGEEGYPGTVQVAVLYILTPDNELVIEYQATTDLATPVNLTNHSYFNLSGGKAQDALGHVLSIAADRFVTVSKSLIPTGELPKVAGTPMDFQTPVAIGARIGQVPGGYDHTYVLKETGKHLKHAATVEDPVSGRCLEVCTTEPGIQFYSGNFLDGSLQGHGGTPYKQHYGFCLETQHFPDSPNQPAFPNTILEPDQKYHQKTVYRFYVCQDE